MNMNVIKSLKCNVKAEISYEVPTSGDFVALWEYKGVPFSATYRWKDDRFLVCDDFGCFTEPGKNRGADYYDYHELIEMVEGARICQPIAFVRLEVETA